MKTVDYVDGKFEVSDSILGEDAKKTLEEVSSVKDRLDKLVSDGVITKEMSEEEAMVKIGEHFSKEEMKVLGFVMKIGDEITEATIKMARDEELKLNTEKPVMPEGVEICKNGESYFIKVAATNGWQRMDEAGIKGLINSLYELI